MQPLELSYNPLTSAWLPHDPLEADGLPSLNARPWPLLELSELMIRKWHKLMADFVSGSRAIGVV